MKTLIIFIDFEEFPRYFFIDGDYSHLDKTLINQGINEKLENELSDLLYDKDGFFKYSSTVDFPKEVLNIPVNELRIITSGVLP